MCVCIAQLPVMPVHEWLLLEPSACHLTLYLVLPTLHFSALLFLFPRLVITLVCFICSLHSAELPAVIFFFTFQPVVTPPNHLTRGDVNPDFRCCNFSCAGLSIKLFPLVKWEPGQCGFILMSLCCAVPKWEYSRLESVACVYHENEK